MAHGLLRIIRFPAPLSALTDILAGAGLAGVALAPAQLGPLLGASFCLYSGGMALNDFADRGRDARLRPDRPIPAGELSAGLVAGVGFGLLATGVGLAAAVGRVPLLVACGVALAILAYDFLLKAHRVGLLGMGLCRAGNLLLGGSLALPQGQPALWAGAAGMLCYVVCLTGASLAEDENLPVRVRALFLGGMLLALSSPLWIGPRHPLALVVLLPAAGLLLAHWKLLAGEQAGGFIKWGVLGIMLLDAGFLLALGAWTPAAVCVGLYAASLLWPRPNIS